MKRGVVFAIAFGMTLGTIVMGCQSSGGGGGDTTVTLKTNPDYDGYLYWKDGGSFGSGTLSVWEWTAKSIGDESNNMITQITWSFDLGMVPTDATVTSAILRGYCTNVENDPFGSLGAVHATHVTYSSISYDIRDDSTNPSVQTILGNAGALATSGAVGWHQLDVTANVAGDLAQGRGRSQFRIDHADGVTNSNDTAEGSTWTTYYHASYNPELVITYSN